MKKIFILLSISTLFINEMNAQYFQGSFRQDVTDNVNLKIAFTIKPTANITTQISYMEAAFRFPTATTPAFTITNTNSNTALFPGLSIQRFTPDYAADGYTYYKFVFNTAILPSAAYTATDYTLFDITTSLPAASKPAFEMISNLTLTEYQFGATDGAGNFLDPDTGDQLYGPGFHIIGDDHIVPLFAGALPVTFRRFSVVKKDKDAQLDWSVENQDVNTSHFIIERSVNGVEFESIKTITVNLASGAEASYQYTDLNVADILQPVVYYRIKQVDKDGQFVYTKILSVKFDKQKRSQLYPNPVLSRATLSFHLETAQKIIVIVTDAAGKAVRQIKVTGMKGENQQSIDVSRLPAGTYKLSIHSGESVETLQLIKGR